MEVLMILATYQPIQKRPFDEIQSNKSDILGYNPIWCVSAETLEEFICQSYFCAPNCGEELIFFETENYDTVDKCAWYNAIKENINNLDPSWINSDCKFKEYVVEKIENVIFRMPMDIRDWDLTVGDFEPINPILKEIINHTRQTQDNFQFYDSQGRIQTLSNVKSPRAYQIYIALNIEFGLLPIIHSIVIKKDPVDFMRFHGNQIKLLPIKSKFMEWNLNDCSENGFAKVVNEFYSLFDKSFAITQRKRQGKIGRNEPCPCGSGKKWKKCCGINSF